MTSGGFIAQPHRRRIRNVTEKNTDTAKSWLKLTEECLTALER